MASSFAKEYSKLNKQQKLAVDTIDGPVLVLAGPGTGKTQLLSLRVANIIRVTDTDPSNILCLTFTEAAAFNMRERLLSLIGPSAHKIPVYTFHGFGSSIIQSYPEYFYDKPLTGQIEPIGEYRILTTILEKLPHSNPFSTKIGDKFFHINSLIRSISWVKQSGLTNDELNSIARANIEVSKKLNPLLKTTFRDIPSARQSGNYLKLRNELQRFSQNNRSELLPKMLSELENAIDGLDPKKSTAKPVTSWRNKWLSQTKLGIWQLSDTNPSKLFSFFCKIYTAYQEELANNGFYGFDDMILRTTEAINQNDDLKLSLQERYQYILVDEFQDTSGAQNKLLLSLVDNPLFEGRPNLMTVGDGDQAIYRFQGADKSIITGFVESFKDVSIIKLETSYRSGQELLNLAENVISQSSERLDVKGDHKALISSSNNKTKIHLVEAVNQPDLYIYISSYVKGLIKKGIEPSQIAVLAPRHHYLEKIVSDLNHQSIVVKYERRELILSQTRIKELLDLVNLLAALASNQIHTVNVLLSNILASEYIGLTDMEWFSLALRARSSSNSWLEAITDHDNPTLNNFSQAILSIAKSSKNQPFIYTLSQITGNSTAQIRGGKEWLSPWREFYYSKKQIDSDPQTYLKFLNQLNSLISAFGSFSSEPRPGLADFRDFINLYQQSGIPLATASTGTENDDAVFVDTVYKAKGLEWDYVILLNCQEDVWGPKARTRHQTFRLPSNLDWIKPAGEITQDLIRLFYVGVTRARRELLLTSTELNEKGNPVEPLSYLDQANKSLPKPQKINTPSAKQRIQISELTFGIAEKDKPELGELLAPILKTYKLSATHLNNFLSLEYGGPESFFYNDLLKVPKPVNFATMYGDAIHRTLEYIHRQLKVTNKFATLGEIKNYFTEQMQLYPLPKQDLDFYLKKGIDNISSWLIGNKARFSIQDVSEQSFNSENVYIDNTGLTGKIDVLRLGKDGSLTVIDYKTSRPLTRWQGHNQSEAQRGRAYLRQLQFYKLLVEKSKNWGGKYSVSSGEINFLTPNVEGEYLTLSTGFDIESQLRLETLIGKVWSHITLLNFPDITKYPKSLAGTISLEDDLLNDRI